MVSKEAGRTIRRCQACDRRLTIYVFPNGKYRGGNYFGKLRLKDGTYIEEWECNRCWNQPSKKSLS